MLGQTFPPEWLNDLLAAYDQVLTEIAVFAIAFVVVYLLGQLVLRPSVVRVVRARNHNNPTIESATRTYVRVFVIAFATITGIVVAGYGRLLSDTAIIIAALTFLLGIAGQQVFGSLISGMFLVADPEFNVGDWIRWPNGRGTIEAVDFRVTRIRTPDNEIVSVPNIELTGNAITRPYGRDRFRITEPVHLAYYEDTERALQALRQLAIDTDGVLEEPAPNTVVTDLGENAITAQAEFWIDDPMDADVPTIRSDFRRAVKRHFDEADLTLGPPSAQLLSGEIAVVDGATDGPPPSGA
ncbi:MAG: mechanosensitive ion channel family protein [Halobacteriota archaeon]